MVEEVEMEQQETLTLKVVKVVMAVIKEDLAVPHGQTHRIMLYLQEDKVLLGDNQEKDLRHKRHLVVKVVVGGLMLMAEMVEMVELLVLILIFGILLAAVAAVAAVPVVPVAGDLPELLEVPDRELKLGAQIRHKMVL